MENQYLRLREIMAERNVTGKQLSESVGITTAAMSAIVTGKSQPRFELLAKIADYLGMEMRDLFKGSDGEPLFVKEGGELKEVGYLKKML